MQRKLASIQIIEELNFLPQFDNLVYAKVLGWNALVRSGEFEVGEKVIYIEYDSILPSDIPEFAFMESRKFLVKTLKMRGVLSQGLVFPISLLNRFGMDDNQIESLAVGTDLTEILRIIKYEIPENLKLGFSGNIPFPPFIPKTDEIRLQSAPDILVELHIQGDFYVSLKEDGSSATYYLKTDYKDELIHVGVCSRNMESVTYDPNNAYWKIFKELDIERKLKDYFEGTGQEIAIQGEIGGPGMNGSGIRKNPMGYSQLMFKVFNIYNITQKKYLDYYEMIALVEKFNLCPVDTILIFNETEKRTVEEWIEFANKQIYPVNLQPAEGIVIRPIINRYSSTLKDRFSFKVISNNFLIK